MRQIVSILAILTVSISLRASAQEKSAPRNIDEQTSNQTTQSVPFTDLADALLGVNMRPPLSANCRPPVTGLHCVYYAGDFNPNPAKQPNVLFNHIFHDGANTIDGQVWVAIPIKSSIVVQGLLINELFASPPDAHPLAHWQIRQGITAGDGGT